jgi:hypothetical protein
VSDAAVLSKFAGGKFFYQYFLPVLSDGNPGVVPNGLLIVKTFAELDDSATKGIATIVLNVGKTVCIHPKCVVALERHKNLPNCLTLPTDTFASDVK